MGESVEGTLKTQISYTSSDVCKQFFAAIGKKETWTPIVYFSRSWELEEVEQGLQILSNLFYFPKVLHILSWVWSYVFVYVL